MNNDSTGGGLAIGGLVPALEELPIPGTSRTYVRTHARTYVRTYVRTVTYVPTYVRTYVRTYVHTYVRMYVRTYVHICGAKPCKFFGDHARP